MKTKYQFRILLALSISLFSLCAGLVPIDAFAQSKNKHYTLEEKRKRIQDHAFKEADYIIEVEIMEKIKGNGSENVKMNKFYQNDTTGQELYYYILNISKIFKGSKDLKKGTIVIHQESFPNISTNMGGRNITKKSILFCKRSKFKDPANNPLIDNNISLTILNNYVISFDKDSIGNEEIKGFGTCCYDPIPAIKFKNEEELYALFKNRKDVNINDIRESYYEKIKVENNNFIREKLHTDTIDEGMSRKEARKKYEQQFRELFLNRDFSGLPDSSREKIKKQILIECPSCIDLIDDMNRKKKQYDREQKRKKKSNTGARIEMQSAVPNVQYAVRNRAFSDSLGMKYF